MSEDHVRACSMGDRDAGWMMDARMDSWNRQWLAKMLVKRVAHKACLFAEVRASRVIETKIETKLCDTKPKARPFSFTSKSHFPTVTVDKHGSTYVIRMHAHIGWVQAHRRILHMVAWALVNPPTEAPVPVALSWLSSPKQHSASKQLRRQCGSRTQ